MNRQIRDHAEVALVAGHQSVTEVKRGSANEEIGERDHQSLLASLGIDLRDDVSDVAGKGFRWDGGKDRLQIAAALGGLLRRLGAVDAVLQFDHANRRENDFGHAVLLLKPVQQHAHGKLLTLGEDEHAGVQH